MKNVSSLDDLMLLIDKKIKYGYVDINENIHHDKKNFKSLYQKPRYVDILKLGVGSDIEKVSLEAEFLKENFHEYVIYNLQYDTEKFQNLNTVFIIYEDNDYYNFIMNGKEKNKIISFSKDKYSFKNVIEIILRKRYNAIKYTLTKLNRIPKKDRV